MVRDLHAALAHAPLAHGALVAGLKHYLGPFEAYAQGKVPETPFPRTNRGIGARLYLSHRTVGPHLSRIFPKLGITSRRRGAAPRGLGSVTFDTAFAYPQRVSAVAPDRRPTPPPARQIRLLANLDPAAGVVFALLAVGSGVSAFRGVGQLVTGQRAVGEPVCGAVLLVLLGAAAAVVFALVAHRLLVRVPRTLRGWQEALAGCFQAMRGE